jgi:hypothetical protein
MRWVEPDLDHAVEGLTWVYQNRAAANARAMAAAHRLRRSFSFEQVGAMAKARLLELLRQSRPQKLAVIRKDGRDLRPQSMPIPGDWFDADYFEHGLKSNWGRGYNWPDFKGLFGDAAAYIAEMFPEARSFLEWWQREFINAGWRQDALHHAFQRMCQSHVLPNRMRWNVYVFSPGE